MACRASILIVLAIVLLTATVSSAQQRVTGDALRPSHPWIARAIGDARGRSRTFDDLLARLNATHTIVQVVEDTEPSGSWDGRISFLAFAGGHRYLRLGLRRQTRAAAAAVVAHELQHALEIDAANVASQADFERLYARIGVPDADVPGQVDTAAAVRAGVATLEELTGQPVLLSATSRRVLAVSARTSVQ